MDLTLAPSPRGVSAWRGAAFFRVSKVQQCFPTRRTADRLTHPELAAAAWSSSGVVNAIYNYTNFDEQLAESVGPACASGIRAVTAAFEAAWDDDAKRAAMIALYGSSAELTKGDFAWMLADRCGKRVVDLVGREQ